MSRRAPPRGRQGSAASAGTKTTCKTGSSSAGAAKKSSTGSASTPGSIRRSPRRWARFKDYWNAGSSFFARFRSPAGGASLNEAASEGFTLGAGGFVVMFALALPAFLEFDEGKLPHRPLRRQVPRPERQRDRQARHPAQRRRAARGDPRRRHQGDARHRGPPLLRALRHRRPRHLRARSSRTCTPTTSCRAARRSRSSSPRTCSCRPSARSSARSRRCSSPSCSRAASPSARS